MRTASVVAGMTAVTLFGLAGQVRARPFVVGTWTGSVEGFVDFSRQDIETKDATTSRFDNMRTEERITLRNVGAYLYDPLLLSVTAGGTFGLSQLSFKSPAERDSDSGSLSGYDVSASILSNQPFSLRLFANRFESFPPVLGGRSEVRTETRGARLLASRLYIPSFVTVGQVLSRQESTTAGVVSREERRRNTFRYEGQRGWTDSEVDLFYEFIDENDEVFPELGYRSQDGNLNYGRDFGTELNWHWDSRLRHFDRTGVSDLTISTIDELLRIEHTDDLDSELRYAFRRTKTAGGTTSRHAGSATLSHQLYDSVTTEADLGTTIQKFPLGEINTYRGRLDIDYLKRLPGDGRLAVGVGGGLEYDDQRFEDTESLVLQESHTAASPFALPIALENPFVVASSVVVTKIATGPLPPGCISPPGPPTPLVVGQDYTLRGVGDITEIVPIPCAGTTPGINPGDTIAVDYSFTTPADLTISTVSWRADVSVDYGWIRPFFSHEQTDQTLVSGRDNELLDDLRSDTFGIELSHERPRLRANLLAEARRFESDRLTFDSIRSVPHASATLLPRLTLNVNGELSRVEFEDPARRSDTLAGRANLTYAFDANLVAEASGGIRILEDTVFPREEVRDLGLRFRWQFRRLEVRPVLEFFDRKRGETGTQELRFILRTIRRF